MKPTVFELHRPAPDAARSHVQGAGQAQAGPPNAPCVHVWLDGRPHTLATPCTLAELVHGLGHAPEVVGTAVNGAFVARAARTQHRLRDGDAIVLFQPIVGG
jgi:sulfur carrier protein